MIVGIGCDIVEHETTKNLHWDLKISVVSRIFSQKELETYSSKKELSFLSGRFAAKEAVLKCLGTGMIDGIALTDIQIQQLFDGKPQIELSGKVKTIADKMGINLWNISITHSSNYSFAVVVAEKI